MATQHVVARVVDGDELVDGSVRRPVRLTPDGGAGVVYAGAVYPLYLDDVVDIAGPSWEIEDCNRFLLVGANIPYARRSSQVRAFEGFSGLWAIETNDFGHYLVFDADERGAIRVVELLEGAGLAVQRWDVSHRLASDGRFYDWFARLRSKAPHDEVFAHVADAFVGRSPALTSRAGAVVVHPVEELEARVEELLAVNGQLRTRMEAAVAAETQLRQRLDISTKHQEGLAQDLDRALEHHAVLYRQVAELRQSQGQDEAVTAFLAEQLATEELLELALSENAELWKGLSSAQDAALVHEQRAMVLEATLQQAQDRFDELRQQEREQRRSKTVRPAPRRGLEGFLATAFGRLDLVLDTVEVVANLDSPSAVLRCLVQIDMGDRVGQDLEGLRGWRKVSKLATGIAGSEDMGRVYYKPGGGRVLVSVHIKQDDKEQRRHLERLRPL